jgi:hypothetical protein
VNKHGERTKVVLDVDEYERLVEAVEGAEDRAVRLEELVKLERWETERILRVPR